ncbi:MAG: hypothetical protein KatS3mg008_0566 [Acidimicrobiales bacterium]|nr:MAG: hypothetical protein KatS3mg008_0566 [Acidimicrobiales bacterium]
MEDGPRDLRDHIQVLRRRRFVFLASSGLVVLVAMVFTYLQPPAYRSTAEILFPQETSPIGDTPTRAVDAARRIANEVTLIESALVDREADRAIGLDVDCEADSARDADVIRVHATSGDPHQAARMADACVEAYLRVRAARDLDQYEQSAEVARRRIAEIDRKLQELEARSRQSGESADSSEVSEPGASESEAVPAATEEEISRLSSERIVWVERLAQIEAAGDLARISGPRVIDEARVPTSPIRPRPLRNGILAALVGLAFGTAVAFLVDFLDDSVKSTEDAHRATAGLPVLALVPRVATWRGREAQAPATLAQPSSPAAEAYRSLKTAIQFKTLDAPPKVLVVTSPGSGDGKSTAVANLAVAAARSGMRVVAVSCDLRRPRLHEHFHISNHLGFTSVLAGEASLSAVVHRVPEVEDLLVLPSGPPAPNPAELLQTARAREVFRILREEADLTIVDTPPVIPVTDSLVLSEIADAILLVVRAGSTGRRATHRAVEMLAATRARLVGIVFNDVSETDGYGYAYGAENAYVREDMSSEGLLRSLFAKTSRRDADSANLADPDPRESTQETVEA